MTKEELIKKIMDVKTSSGTYRPKCCAVMG